MDLGNISKFTKKIDNWLYELIIVKEAKKFKQLNYKRLYEKRKPSLKAKASLNIESLISQPNFQPSRYFRETN